MRILLISQDGMDHGANSLRAGGGWPASMFGGATRSGGIAAERSWAGALAGTLFAFLPFRVAHYRAGHLNIMGTMWFPLFFMALFAALKRGKAERSEILLGGVALGLIGLTSQYGVTPLWWAIEG